MTAAIILLFMVACSLPVYAAPSQPAVRSGLSFDTEGIADIAPYKRVFYLPSSIDVTAVEFDTSSQKYTYYGESEAREFPSDHIIDLTPGVTSDKYGNTCYKIMLDDGLTYSFYSASSIGTVYVSTSNGVNYLRTGKNHRDKESRLIITDASGKALYDDVSGDTLSEIKGRGNASYANEKKPFQIKLGKKTDLFGMGKAKTWILLANYNDASYMRNTCAFKIAEALELPYTPKSVFVDLYIDNEYQGIYQLCEKTQIGTNRIEITDLENLNEKANDKVDLDTLGIAFAGRSNDDSTNLKWYKHAVGMSDPKDITGGYLIELDNLYAGAEKCVFETVNGNQYTIKSPEVSSQNEMRYISDLFSRFEQALYSETGYDENGVYYTEYCDFESLVKVYIVEEITKNWDAYIGSVYFYKDVDKDGVTSKIYAGPVWDFDNTWGNIRGRGTFATDLTEIWADGDNNNGGFSYKQDFGAALMQHEDAKQLASELYSKAAYCVEEMLSDDGDVYEIAERIASSAAMDMMRWPVEKRSQTFLYYNSYNDGTTDSAVGYLRNFMAVRTEALYDAFNAEHIGYVEAHTHTLGKVEAVAATCTEGGTEAYWECTECGKMFLDEKGENRIFAPVKTKPAGHTAREAVIENRKEATCESDGGFDKVKYCVNCGEEMYRVRFSEKATGHDWGEWTVAKEATPYEEGLEIRTCKNDPSHTETRTIVKTEVDTTATETTVADTSAAETSATEAAATEVQTEMTETVTTEATETQTDATPENTDTETVLEDEPPKEDVPGSTEQTGEAGALRPYIKYVAIGVAALALIVLIVVVIKRK